MGDLGKISGYMNNPRILLRYVNADRYIALCDKRLCVSICV